MVNILILLSYIIIATVRDVLINNNEREDLANTCSFTIFVLKGYLSSAEIAL